MRDIASRHGITFGCAVEHPPLETEPDFAAAVVREAAMLVPEGAGKWWSLWPHPGVFNPEPLGRILGFAARHGLAVRGHTLLWHAAMRDWTYDALTEGRARAEALLEAHLDAVLDHTRATIRDWDVANEAVANPWDSTDLLKDTPWRRALGPGYLEALFRGARARDATLTLTYNDYGCEHATGHDVEKRRRVLALVRGFRDRGVPIDAVGLQGHLHRDLPFDARMVTDFVRALRALDLRVPITELDVIEPEIHGAQPGGVAPGPDTPDAADIAARDARGAARVHAFVSAVLEGGGGDAVLCWGISDRHSWSVRAEPAARPLPLDAALARKPMWYALAAALAGRPWPGGG